MTSRVVSYLRNYQSINVFLKIMPHIKVVFLWPYARVGDVHPARAYAYASIPFVHMHTANTAPSTRAYGHRKMTFMWGMTFRNTLIL